MMSRKPYDVGLKMQAVGAWEAMVENECAMMALPANGTFYHKATSRVITQRLVTGQKSSHL